MNTEQKPPEDSTWLGIGAMLAAIAASVCCVVPLLLLSLGIGGAWMSNLTAMTPFRPFFIILTLVFIGLGFRKLYLTPDDCHEGQACSTLEVKQKQRLIFWIGSVFILLLLALPSLATSTSTTVSSSEQQSLQSVTFDMKNMTCAMCATTIKKALQGVNGVKTVMVDSDKKTAVVTFDTKKTTINALIAATTRVGYPATVQP